MKALRILSSLILLFLAVHIVWTVADGTSDNGLNVDIAVIFGNKVNRDGTLSPRLEKRLEQGLRLYRDGRVKILLVSGGLGEEGYYEGDKMREYLVACGVPDSVIIVDNKGDNTIATVENTINWMNGTGLEQGSIVAISQYYHISRIKMIFRKKGWDNISGSSPSYFEMRDIYSLLREVPAFYYYFLSASD